LRAYEVIEQTGKSILLFQNEEKFPPLKDYKFEIYYLKPERQFLYYNCNKRFQDMFQELVIPEIQNILDKNIQLSENSIKAIGVMEALSYLKDEISYETAITLACNKTRQYAKRQTTWFNNQLKPEHILEYDSVGSYKDLFEHLTLK
jgi:tRNA dimethylallyltransferase